MSPAALLVWSGPLPSGSPSDEVQVLAGFGEGGPQPQRLGELGDGVVVASLSGEGGTQVVVDLGHVGFEPDRLSEQAGGVGEPTLTEPDPTQADQGRELEGIELQRLAEAGIRP